MTTQTEALKLARQLLWRYRHETPIGNQPHMICHEVDEAFERIDEALAQPEQEPVAWKLVPIEPTREMLEAMDECSIEGYDEHLYAGHAASVYMAAVDVAPTPPQPKEPEQEPVTPFGLPLFWDAPAPRPDGSLIDEGTKNIEQEPVACLIIDEKINSIQVNSIQHLIDRAKHAHMADIKLRINGQDEWYQADWIKHITQITELKCDGDFPEGFDASCGIPAQALRAANSIMCDVNGKREWDVPCVAKHLIAFTKLYTAPPQPQSEARGLSQSKPLTNKQIDAIDVEITKAGYCQMKFARAIEAAHGIKE